MKLQNYKIRLMQEKDLESVLHWRNSERIRKNMYTDRVISLEEHRNWFARLRPEEHAYLVFEVGGQPVGLVYFTDIDHKNGTSFWGFYVGEEAVPKGTGMRMGCCGLQYGFERLMIRKISGEAFAFNQASIHFHRKLGFIEEGVFRKHIIKDQSYEDIVRFALFHEDWQELKGDLFQRYFGERMSY